MSRVAPQKGATLLEISLVLGVAVLILLAALAHTRGLWPLFGVDRTEHVILQTQPRVAALQAALRDWYVFEYCSGLSSQTRTPLSVEGRVPANTPAATDLEPYLYDDGDFLSDASQGAYEWEIVRYNSPTQVRVFWTPPGTQKDLIEVLARRLGAECDWPGCSRLAWPRVVATAEDYRNSLLQKWLTEHGIDCDLDDDGSLDDFCDGSIDDDLIDSGQSVVSPDGQSYPSSKIDSNGDGRLDYDFNSDFAVDSEDYQGWGC